LRTHCFRNALRLLRDLSEKIQVKQGGVIDTPEGEMVLMAGWNYGESELKKSTPQQAKLTIE
jgi:hypothetical protein